MLIPILRTLLGEFAAYGRGVGDQDFLGNLTVRGNVLPTGSAKWSPGPFTAPGPIYIDFDGTFTDRKAVLTIREDTGSSAPTNIQPTVHIITRSRGDNTTFIGATSIYAQTRDRTDVVAGTKGVLYVAQFDVNPLVARNNSPFDDADGIVITNSDPGAFKATDAIYLGHNSAFGTNREFITGFQVAANCDFDFFSGTGTKGTGLELRATYASYGIDMKSGVWTGAAGIRFQNNMNAIVGRNAADGADLTMMKMNSNNDVALGNAGTIRVNCTSSQLGFYGATPVAKPTVTGSKAANAALASLMSALAASLGLVTDSTTWAKTPNVI
jgi:hypothetical protein